MNSIRFGTGLALSLSLLISSPGAEVSLTKVANLDDVADGTGGGNFIDFNEGYLNGSDEVLIEATGLILPAPGVVRGLWTGEIEMPLVVAGLQGDTIPGGGGAFDGIWFSLFADTGEAAFRNRLSGSTSGGGVFSYPAGGPTTREAVVGDPAPGLVAAESFVEFRDQGQALNDLGGYIYWAETTNTLPIGVPAPLNTGFWDDSGLRLFEGDDTANPPTATLFFGEIAPEIGLNDSGECVFGSFLTGAITGTTNEALFAGTVPGPDIVVREGDDASALDASLPASTEFFRASSGSINAAGDVSFRSSLRGPGITAGNTIQAGVLTSNDISIWTNSGGTTVLLAQEGTPALGFPAGQEAVYTDFDQPIICDNGHVYFHATIAARTAPAPPPAIPTTNSTNEALYRFIPGSGLSLVAREGGAAPDTAGALFSSLNTYAVSDNGRIAFRGNLVGGDATASTNHGLWIDENDGAGPILNVRESDTFQLDLATRTIADITVSKRIDGGGGGRPSALSEDNVIMKVSYGVGGKGFFTFGLPPYEIIAATGMLAPGTGGLLYESIRPVPTIAADGRAIFRAHIDDITPPRDKQGIWYEELGAIPATDPFVLTKMARQGDPIPGLGGAVWENMTRLPAWTDAGDTTFFGSIRYDVGLGIDKWNTFGVWSDPDGTAGSSLLIRGSDTALLGVSNATAEVFEVSRRAPPMNSFGQVPYTALFRFQEPLQPPPDLVLIPGAITKDNNSAIGVFDGIMNRIVAQEGETPSLSTVNAGATFDYLLNNSELFISDDGTFIFEGLLREGTGAPAVTPETESGIWVADASSGTLLKALAQGGMLAPGPGTAGNYLTPVKAALSRKPVGGGGTPAVFRSTLTGGAITAADDVGLFYTPDAVVFAPTRIAQSGFAAPDTLDTFADFVHPMMNHNGHIAFRAELTGGATGLWSSLSTSPTPTPTLTLEILSGDPAPDVPGATIESFEPPIVGDGEQFAFVGHMAIGGSVTDLNNTGLWARLPGGGFRLLFREGATVTLPTAAGVVVSAIDIGGYNKASHRPQQMVAINTAGQFVFWLEFVTGESAAVRMQL